MAALSERARARQRAEATYSQIQRTLSRRAPSFGDVTPQSVLLAGTGAGSPGLDAAARHDQYNHHEQLSHYRDQVFTSVRPIADRIAAQPIRLALVSRAARGKTRFVEQRLKNFPPFIRHKALALKANEDLTIVDQSPILDALHAPAPAIPGFVGHSVLKFLATNLALTGVAYLWRVVTKGKSTLWPLPSDWVRPETTDQAVAANWIIQPMQSAEEKRIAIGDIARFYEPHPANPLVPLGALQAGIRSILVDEFVTEALKRSYQLGIHPGAIIYIASQVLKGGKNVRPRLRRWQMNQIADAVTARYGGLQNFGKPLIADGLIEKIEDWGHTPKQMDFGASQASSQARVEQIFGTNPYQAGAASLGSRAEAAEARRQFCESTVNPKIELVSQVLTQYVLPWFDSSGRYLLYVEPAVAEDPELDGQNWTTALTKGAGCTIDEYRTHMLGLPPLPQGRGQVVMIPSGYTLQPIAAPTPQDPESAAAEEAEGDEAPGAVGTTNDEGEPAADEQPALGAPAAQQGQPGASGGADDGTGKALKAAFYKALGDVWLKQHENHEARLVAALEALFASQGNAIAEKLQQAFGHVAAPSDTLTGARMLATLYDSDHWLGRLKETIRDGLKQAMLVGASQELETFGKPRERSARRVATKAGADLEFEFGVDLPDVVRQGIDKTLTATLAKDYWQTIDDTTRDNLASTLQGALDDGKPLHEIIADVRENVFGKEIARNRAENIARTEVTNSLNAGAQLEREQLHADGLVDGKTWFSTHDSRTRAAHVNADGQVVAVDGKFLVGGEEADHPGDPNLSARQRCRCRCFASSTVSGFSAAVLALAKGGRGSGPHPGSGAASRRARAKKTHKASTKAKQDHAEKNEALVAHKLGAARTGDNKPMDHRLSIGGKSKHGIELKTMLDNANNKITMHPASRRRKEAWVKQNKATGHTIVLDHRDRFAGGKNAHQYSGHEIYYKRGFGAFRVGTMHKAKNWAEVKRLIGTPANKLPADAR